MRALRGIRGRRSLTVSGVVERLPDLIPGPGALVLRRWVPEDAPVLGEAVRESVEHLRPWMVSQEKMISAGCNA